MMVRFCNGVLQRAEEKEKENVRYNYWYTYTENFPSNYYSAYNAEDKEKRTFF